jgi:hypothetical protein
MTGNEPGAAPRRFVIVHGHFYQPPRENPWLEIIERQPSAAPYHDWNECVHDQCYRPNAFSRLLDGKGMIVDIHNNYRNMSFNFGPTLFTWLVRTHPEIAQRIVDADRESRGRLGGHGNAIGQVYNHSIMPLLSERDQLTQIRWAKDYFRRHFARDAEGLWLAETAINMATVRCLVEEGIRFVILSPSQAEAVRPLDGGDWHHVGGGLDARRPYRVFPQTPQGARLPGHLDVFFFNEALSREISFGDVLADANRLGAKIRSCFDHSPREDAVVVIATDGETFGHHKPLSDMCLSYFFCKVAGPADIHPVNFGWYLEKHPPAWEAKLRNAFGEGTAWSCAHGVGRWSRDCGCKTGGPASWRQEWRAPLRAAFEHLQKKLDRTFEETCSPLFADPWKVRDAYLPIAAARSFSEARALMEACGALKPLSGEEALVVRRLLEAQKYIQFAFTSCGWFFSDVSGIETVQNIAFAARALQLGAQGPEQAALLREELLSILEKAKSNRPEVTARTLFESELARYFRFQEIVAFAAVAEKMVLLEEKPRLFAFDHDNFHVTMARIESFRDRDGYCAYAVDLKQRDTFAHSQFAILLHQNADADITGTVLPGDCVREKGFSVDEPRSWVEHDRGLTLTLGSLFEESSSQLARHFLDQLSRDTRRKYVAWLDRNEKIIASLCSLRSPIPDYVRSPITFIITDEWNVTINELEIYGREEEILARLESLCKKVHKYGISIDFSGSVRFLEQLLSAEITIFAATLSPATCDRMQTLLTIVDRFKIPVAKSRIEEVFHAILRDAIRPLYDKYRGGHAGEPGERETVTRLLAFARRMNFNTDEFSLPDKPA